MAKHVRVAAVLSALVIAVFTEVDARAASSPPAVSADEATVIDGWTGHTLYALHANEPHDPASTVKIMTALVLLRRHVPLDRVVTVSPYAATIGGSSAGLYAGERLTVWNLLHGMLLPSGNDAAIALAQAVNPDVGAFVGLMNTQVTRLHLRHTHFVNPNGYDTPGQFTTAHDLARIARAAMDQPAFAQTVKTRFWTAWSADGRSVHQWTSLNKLLWWYSTVDGVKTGTTPGAGACLVSSARLAGTWVIAVNLGSTEAARFADAAALLDYGLAAEGAPPLTR
jgi:D-alanyl-D-alanine carboxypeptidase (penicillin-binding protein 5/6)